MNRSDWIALAACIAAFLGLIPAFYQIFKNSKNKTGKTKKTSASKLPTSNDTEPSTDTPKEQMPPMLRAFYMVLTAFVIFLIELILFSAVAYFFNVKVDFETMSFIWRAAFMALFIVPGLLLFFALMVITTMFSD